MYGTAQFSAILNPPQSGILAVGAARPQPVVGADGELEVGMVMTVTLSADHRVLAGANAAEWPAAFKRRIDRKSVGMGKSVSVRVDLGWRHITKQKTNKIKYNHTK